MPSLVDRAGVATPIPTGSGGSSKWYSRVDPSSMTMDGARQNLFARCGRLGPHWKKVIYDARHRTSIIGAQVHMLAEIRALIPQVIEFEVSPDKWVPAAEHEPANDAVAVAISIAVRTWRMFRSESGSPHVPIRSASEVFGSTGEGYGIQFMGRNGSPSVAVVHTPAIEVAKDGSGKWMRREGGDPVALAADQFDRLFVEDETFIDDCTSPFRWLADDIAHMEIIDAAIRAGGTADLVSRGLIWAPPSSQNQKASWINNFMDIVEQVRNDPTILGGLVPFPVSEGIVAPEFVSLGNIQETLIKSHELIVDKIARASPLPAKIVKDGPGEGNAYADQFLNRAFLQYHVAPLLEQHVYPDLAAWWWHPRLTRNRQFVATGVTADRFRIVPNIAKVANKPDSRKEALAARLAGIVTKEFVGDQLGASDDDLLRAGTPAWDEWLQERQATAANAANGLADGTPATDGTEPPIDPDTVGDGTSLGPRFATLGALW